MADADFARERIEVEKLSYAPREQDEEAIERGRVLDVRNLPDVTLKIGLQIVLVVDVRIDCRRRELGHSAAKNQGVLRKIDGLSRRLQLGKGNSVARLRTSCSISRLIMCLLLFFSDRREVYHNPRAICKCELQIAKTIPVSHFAVKGRELVQPYS